MCRQKKIEKNKLKIAKRHDREKDKGPVVFWEHMDAPFKCTKKAGN